MTKARCLHCNDIFTNVDFDQHNCPALVPQKAGESWGAYIKRSDKAATEWRKARWIARQK